MDDVRGGSEHVTNAPDGGGGGGRGRVVAAVGHRAGPYLMRNGMPKMQSNTQNGHPNLMRRCPSLSMRSNLAAWLVNSPTVPSLQTFHGALD